MRMLAALVLALTAVASPAVAQTPAAASAPAPGIIPQVRAALNANDLAKAQALAEGFRQQHGATPEYLEAFSWLGRGALAQKKYDEAERFALDAYDLCLSALDSRRMDDEPRLPIAIGAAIEVRAQVMAARGQRSDAVYFLRREVETFGATSILARLNKNINLMNLEGAPAFEIAAAETLAGTAPSLASLKGKPVVLFLWAHWCPDCKAMSPILDEVRRTYAATGLTIIGATQRYGYVAARKPADAATELAYIRDVRRESFPWMDESLVPVSGEAFTRYGVSTTPTLVFINRDGTVRLYHPGQMTREAIEPVIRAITAGTAQRRE
ncbi:MAG: redoxin domain-containing protein [Acidobacteria bacterium]|nr:redoxin domain-containing protein [Acidobacteriota bacterium]